MLEGLKARVQRGYSFDPARAADAFMLTYVAEPHLGMPRCKVTNLMATLAAIASPDALAQSAIERSSRRFAECKVFRRTLDARLQEAMDVVDQVNMIDVVVYGLGASDVPQINREDDRPQIEGYWQQLIRPSDKQSERMTKELSALQVFARASEPWLNSLDR